MREERSVERRTEQSRGGQEGCKQVMSDDGDGPMDDGWMDGWMHGWMEG